MRLYTSLLCAKLQGNRILQSRFIAAFVIVRKEEEEKTTVSQFVKSHISGTLEAISLKFGMWSTEVGGSVHSKNRLVSSRQHRAMEVRKLRFRSSCQYTHGCCAPASWAARHTTVCLKYYTCKLCTNYTHVLIKAFINFARKWIYMLNKVLALWVRFP